MKKETVIKHAAIIMDGNGRWAQARSHTRVWGHIRGAGIVSGIVEEADNLGLDALTLYAFSSENWSRPLSEVHTLFNLLKKFLRKERKKIIQNQIRFKVIGDVSHLPDETVTMIRSLEAETAENQGLKLTFAFGYGGRSEIVSSINRFIEQNPGQKITEQELNNHMMVPEAGDVDLLIRTGGDQRISNFLLWQIAYAELYFTPTKWPEFIRKEFNNIVRKVSQRERRFGCTRSMGSLDESTSLAGRNRRQIELIKSGTT